MKYRLQSTALLLGATFLALTSLRADGNLNYPDGYLNLIQEQNRYESVDRDSWQKPVVVMDEMGDLRNLVVADVGAGTGYFTVRLAPFAKKVIATDPSPDMINHLTGRLKTLKENGFDKIVDRVEVRKGGELHSGLKEAEVDRILISNAYHHIEEPELYFKNLRSRLREGGEICIIDFITGKRPVGPPFWHRVYTAEEMAATLERAGYSVEILKGKLPYQSFLRAE